MTIDAQNSTTRRGGGRAALDRLPGRSLRRLWTVLSFGLFGVGALLFGLVYSPLLWLLVHPRERREKVARSSISAMFGLFIAFMGLFVLSWEVHGRVEPDGEHGKNRGDSDGPAQAGGTGRVVVANHPTLIDAVFLMWLLPGADCVVKASHWRNPLLMLAVRAAGYLPNNDDERLLNEGVRRVRAGHTLLLFPQGTRTRPGEEPEFRRGGAVIAARATVPLLPVRIRCTPPALRKGEPWLRVPARRGHFTIEALPLMHPADGIDPGVSERRGTRELTKRLSLLLLEEVN